MKITVSRIFETTKALATDSGQQLQDFINFCAQFSEITLRALRSGLTYDDNFDCETRTLTLQSGVALSLNLTRKPKEIRVRRVINPLYALALPMAWYFGADGQPVIKCTFTPSNTSPVQVEVIILY